MDELAFTYNCPICGKEMIEGGGEATCFFCGRREQADYTCPDGHYQCEDCRLADTAELVARVCAGTALTDPVEIANLIMKHPSVTDAGPQHHIVVAPSILTALANSGLASFRPQRIPAVIGRTQDIPIAVCGTRGDCGACPGAGVVVSILTGANYLSDGERSLALRATAQALEAVAEGGGPRCCKQSVYLTLETTRDFLRRELDLVLPMQEIICPFAARNPECKGLACRFHPQAKEKE